MTPNPRNLAPDPAPGPARAPRAPPRGPPGPPRGPPRGPPGGPRGPAPGGPYRPLFNPLVHELPGKGLGPPAARGPGPGPRGPPGPPARPAPGPPGPPKKSPNFAQISRNFPKNSPLFDVKPRKPRKSALHGPKSPLKCPFFRLYDIYHGKTSQKWCLIGLVFCRQAKHRGG